MPAMVFDGEGPAVNLPLHFMSSSGLSVHLSSYMSNWSKWSTLLKTQRIHIPVNFQLKSKISRLHLQSRFFPISCKFFAATCKEDGKRSLAELFPFVVDGFSRDALMIRFSPSRWNSPGAWKQEVRARELVPGPGRRRLSTVVSGMRIFPQSPPRGSSESGKHTRSRDVATPRSRLRSTAS